METVTDDADTNSNKKNSPGSPNTSDCNKFPNTCRTNFQILDLSMKLKE